MDPLMEATVAAAAMPMVTGVAVVFIVTLCLKWKTWIPKVKSLQKKMDWLMNERAT